MSWMLGVDGVEMWGGCCGQLARTIEWLHLTSLAVKHLQHPL